MRAFDTHFAEIYNDIDNYPSLNHVARALGVTRKTVRNRAGEMRRLFAQGNIDVPELISRVGTGQNVAQPLSQGKLGAKCTETPKEPEYLSQPLIEPERRYPFNRTRYFIFTAAQDGSLVHHDFLDNLEAYAKWLGACEIHIAGFTYNKRLFEEHNKTEVTYHPRLVKYLTKTQIQIGDGLIFAGEMNTLPTAVRPLSGFEAYTKDKWGIFPHTKVQLQSVATAKAERSKQLLTTGAVTMPNYVQKKAGIKAGFHHMIGAVIVELMPDGSFFCRHLLADGLGDDQGGFFDLDRRIEHGEVTTGHRVEAITYGDIHREKLDPEVALTTWGFDVESNQTITHNCLLDRLRPKYQFFHDLADFSARNHHNIGDHHFRFKTHVRGTSNVAEQMSDCAIFCDQTRRDWSESKVVASNHDNALITWLKTADYRTDPENALFFLEAQTDYYRMLAEGFDDPPIFEKVLRDLSSTGLKDIEFFAEDDSFLICGGIECAMHGHLGANGARGNPRQFTAMGHKSNTAHTHSPQIIDGAYVAGVSGNLDLGYNKGLSSWAHSHIITYPSGKRTIITMMEGRWHAPDPHSVKTSLSSREESSKLL